MSIRTSPLPPSPGSDFLALVGYHLMEGNTIPGILLVPSSIPERDPGALVHARAWWVKEARQDRWSIAAMFELLRGREHEEGDDRVHESRPTYARALDRPAGQSASIVSGS